MMCTYRHFSSQNSFSGFYIICDSLLKSLHCQVHCSQLIWNVIISG